MLCGCGITPRSAVLRADWIGAMRRRIIIDTDPGLDDAAAILLALAAADELEVLGIVAVAGNLPQAELLLDEQMPNLAIGLIIDHG